MTQRHGAVEAFAAIGIPLALCGLFLGTAYYVDRAQEVLGHGPLPSGTSALNAYLLTLAVAGLCLLNCAAVYVGLARTQMLTGRLSWLPRVGWGAILLCIVLAPLQRFGYDAWGGLPEFVVGTPAQVLASVQFGIVALLAFLRAVPEAQVSGAGSAPPVVRGLPGRFTPSAWRVLAHMQEEARRFEHGFMGTEHLVLGLLRERDGLAARALVNLGVDVDSARAQIEAIVSRRGALYTGSVGMTRRCRRVVEQAARLARESDRRTVGTGHLLRSLMTDPEDAAGQLLESLGVSERRVVDELRHMGYDTEEMEQVATR